MGPAQVRPHAGHELAHDEWLGQVVVTADLQTQNAIDILAFRREEENRHVRFLTDDAANLDSVEAGKHYVEHDHVRPQLPVELQRFRTVRGKRHTPAFAFQTVCDCISQGRFIVHNENKRPIRIGPNRDRVGQSRLLTKRTSIAPPNGKARVKSSEPGRPDAPFVVILCACGCGGARFLMPVVWRIRAISEM